jgi:hypothetical protein
VYSLVRVDHWPNEGVVELGRSEKGGQAGVLLLSEFEDLDHELGGELGDVAAIASSVAGVAGEGMGVAQRVGRAARRAGTQLGQVQ